MNIGRNFMLEKIKELIKELDSLTEEHAHFGACDTEPRANFRDAVSRIVHKPSKDIRVPMSASEWELFSDMDGVDEVATRMTEITLQICNLIKQTPLGEAEELAKALRIEFWGIGE